MRLTGKERQTTVKEVIYLLILSLGSFSIFLVSLLIRTTFSDSLTSTGRVVWITFMAAQWISRWPVVLL